MAGEPPAMTSKLKVKTQSKMTTLYKSIDIVYRVAGFVFRKMAINKRFKFMWYRLLLPAVDRK